MSEADQKRQPPRRPAPPPQQPSLLVPVSLTIIAVVLMFGFQTYTLMQERQALQTTRKAQEAPFIESQNLRNQFEAIASGAAKLADEGNPNASAIVAALGRAGVTITNEDAASQ